MKGLIYSWLITRKNYFIIGGVLFVFACAGMLLVLPNIDFSENGDPSLLLAANFISFLLSAAALICSAESLGKDLEGMIKSRFADYSLTAGISCKRFTDILLVRNLICLGISFAEGFALMFIYLFASGQQVTAELIMFVPCVVFFIHSIDYWVTPLAIKIKSAEKAGLVLGIVMGFIMGFIIFCIVITNNTINSDGSGMIVFSFDLISEIVITSLLAASYIPTYFICLRFIKGGDMC